MKRLCDFYIRHAGWIGVVFCAAPALVWFIAGFKTYDFRWVYLVRLALVLGVGCPIAAYINRYGVEVWLRKHRSAEGPATILDGILVGAAIGVGIALLPTLVVFIQSNHLEMAKTYVIVTYLAGSLVGAVFGAILASVGRKYLERT